MIVLRAHSAATNFARRSLCLAFPQNILNCGISSLTTEKFPPWILINDSILSYYLFFGKYPINILN